MSLRYIIDAYNLINHPAFRSAKQKKNIQITLADFINSQRLAGSKKNRVILVFDGYPPSDGNIPHSESLVSVFSRKLEADEIIKRLVEESSCRSEIIVVSDDKQVRLACLILHAKAIGIDEFVSRKIAKNRQSTQTREPDLTFSQMQRINSELKKIWLDK